MLRASFQVTLICQMHQCLLRRFCVYAVRVIHRLLNLPSERKIVQGDSLPSEERYRLLFPEPRTASALRRTAVLVDGIIHITICSPP